jgi:hypothetical protein
LGRQYQDNEFFKQMKNSHSIIKEHKLGRQKPGIIVDNNNSSSSIDIHFFLKSLCKIIITMT